MQFYTAACLLDPSAGSIVFCKRYIRFCMESVDIETQIKTNTEKSTRLSRPGSDRTGRAALSVHSDRIWNTDFEMHADSECSESLRMNSNSIEPQPYRQKEYRSYRQKEYRSFYCLIRSGNALNEFLDQALADSSFSASLQVPAQVRLETFILSLASLKIRKALIVTRSAKYRISDFRSHSQEKSIQNQV